MNWIKQGRIGECKSTYITDLIDFEPALTGSKISPLPRAIVLVFLRAVDIPSPGAHYFTAGSCGFSHACWSICALSGFGSRALLRFVSHCCGDALGLFRRGMSTAIGPQRRDLDERSKALFLAFKRQLPHHRLNTAEKQTLIRASMLTARAEYARFDLGTTSHDLVRIERLAARARMEWQEIVIRDQRQRDRSALSTPASLAEAMP
jgi:hypothetical protein